MLCPNCKRSLVNTGFTSARMECVNPTCSASPEYSVSIPVPEHSVKAAQVTEDWNTLDALVNRHGVGITVRYKLNASGGWCYRVLDKIVDGGYKLLRINDNHTESVVSVHRDKFWKKV